MHVENMLKLMQKIVILAQWLQIVDFYRCFVMLNQVLIFKFMICTHIMRT